MEINFLVARTTVRKISASILGKLALTGFVIAAVTAPAPAFAGDTRFEGAWDIVITSTPNPPFAVPFRILRTVSKGTVTDAYAFPPITPTTGALLMNSSGHGSVTRLGKADFQVVVKYFQLDPGNFFGVLDTMGTVYERVTVSDDKDSYISDFTTAIQLPDGTTIATNHGSTRATRIKSDDSAFAGQVSISAPPASSDDESDD